MSTDPLASIAAAANDPQPAPDLRKGQAAEEGGDAYDVAELGADCPVQPLGFLKQKNFFLDHAGQLIELGTEFRKGELMQLFGTRMGWLEQQWPQWKNVAGRGEEPEFEKNGFNQTHAQQGLIMACAKRGLFDPKGKVRGRGAHRDDDGAIVLHCGDRILVGGKRGTRNNVLKSSWYKAGLLGGYVYATAPALPHPDERPAAEHVGEEVFRLLRTWNWKRGEIDAYLLFCWIPAALMGGALKHRPHVWITGPSGAGKTTLQEMMRALMDEWGIFTEDATEAGVRQLLDQDTLPVMFDEIEPDEGNAEVHMKIVKLARLAYSGAESVRGSQDHKAKQFVAKSCFLFSSIHHHDLPAQDRNRIAILHLSKFPPKTAQLVLPKTLQAWGAAMRRRLVEQWHRYPATLEAYQKEMLAQGYSGREQNTYGTLLACGDLLLHADVPQDGVQAALNGEEDRCGDLVRKLAQVLDSARAESEDTTERGLKYLASHRLPARGGESQETVARWITKALVQIISKGDGRAAKDKLLTHGMRIVNLERDHASGNGQGGLKDAYLADKGIYLAIANKTNKGVKEIFDGSTWQNGVWTQAFALVPGAIVNKKSRFGGPSEGCVLVPLEEIVDIDAARDEAREISQSYQQGGPP